MIKLPDLEAIPEIKMFVALEYEGEDKVAMGCPMKDDGTPDVDAYGPVDLEACTTDTLEWIDSALGTRYANPPEPKERREIREHWCAGRTVEVEAATEDEARLKALDLKPGHQAWEVKETSPGKWSCFMCLPEDCWATND